MASTVNHRLKYCWLKIIGCICQHELEREIKHKTGALNGGPTKNLGGGMAHPGPPLESPLYGGWQTFERP